MSNQFNEIRARAGALAKKHMPKDINLEEIGKEAKALMHELEEHERAIYLHVIDRCQGNKSVASLALGVDRKTIYNKLRLARV